MTMTKLDPLIESIRRAVADGADEPTRKAGADACRAILTALGTEPGKPLTDPPPPISPIAAMAAAAQSAPPGLVLDALIGKLKSMLPEGDRQVTRPPSALRIPFVPMPGAGKPGGAK